MIAIPVQVDVEHPFEVTPPGEGVYTIKSLRKICDDDDFMVPDRHGDDVRVDSCGPGLSITRIESVVDRYFWEGTLKLDGLGSHPLNLLYSRLAPIRIVFKATRLPSVFAIVLFVEPLHEAKG